MVEKQNVEYVKTSPIENINWKIKKKYQKIIKNGILKIKNIIRNMVKFIVLKIMIKSQRTGKISKLITHNIITNIIKKEKKKTYYLD
jgi:chemotaxis methyl-accepting protein methylase